MDAKISADFLYESHFVNVYGSRMHYIEEGEGEPILFLHGMPTWSYVWRNIIPYLSSYGRCITVDLIGMGKSDKPDIYYTVFDHIRYINEFIKVMNLKSITLVMHGWGSVIGFSCAMKFPENIKALAFYEAHIRPSVNWEMVSLPVQELSAVLDSPDGGYDVIMNSNYYVNKIMTDGVLRRLSEEEMQQYQMPFITPGSCKPIWQFLQDLPLGEEQSPVVKLIEDYSQELKQSPVPKLLLYSMPGFITSMATVQWGKDNLPNLRLAEVGEAYHFAQETCPDDFGKALAQWYSSI